MQPGAPPDDRFAALLGAASALQSPEERLAFLEAACGREPDLLDRIVTTLTLHGLEGTPPGSPDGVSATPRFLEPGKVLADRFLIVRRLGEGGMAVVYEAEDRKLMERRALKFPKAGHSRTIPPEARSALRVTHRNICRTHEIHSAATDSGPADFISMEFVEGETLLSRWQRQTVPNAEAVQIACQLCRGLEAAHDANVLHRDLKSNNVMLARETDGSLRVVITDFGLARPVGSGAAPASSALGGTPSYIAPERWKGAPASPGSDLYALGVILYEMLAGTLPFPRGASWQARLNQLPEPPSRSGRLPDPRWDPIVLKCLDPDPRKRFASARDVLHAIERAFRVSHRRQGAAAAALALLAVSSALIWRDQIWPPPPVARLALLPFAGSAEDAGVDQAVRGALYDLAGRLQSLGASKRLVVIPLEDSLRYEVDSPSGAAARLGATHSLSGAIGRGKSGFLVRAAVTDLSSGEPLRKYDGQIASGDLKALSTSLAGVVTSAFRLDKAPPASITPDAYPLYAAGLASLNASPPGNEPAIASLQSALKIDSRSPLIYGGLARAFLGRFKDTHDARWLKEASEHARRAESLHPDSPPVLLVMGSIEQAEGRPERAIDYYRRAAELEPTSSEAWRNTGLAFLQAGRESEALGALRRSVQLAPGYYAPHLALGGLYFRMGRYSEAVEEFRIVTQLAPGLAEGHSQYGGVLLATEQEEEAERALRRAIQLQETRRALNNLSVLLRYQNRDREAVDVLERALRAGADDGRLRLNLGNALRRTGRLEDARTNFRRAGELERATLLRDPRDAAARARLAYSMAHVGNPGFAADEALQAARLKPSDYSVLFWSVMTLESLGRRADALSLLAHATQEQLRDLRRQPDLAAFSRDSRFLELLQQSQVTKQTTEGRDHGNRKN